MYYAVASVALLVIGGLSGVFTGVIPVDWQVHNTYYVVAHIHYVLIGSNVFPVFAAFYYWLPKMTGRMMNEKLGKLSFWVMFIGFNLGFFPMHNLGLLGMPRRIFTYQHGLGFGIAEHAGHDRRIHPRHRHPDQHHQSPGQSALWTNCRE